MFCSICAKSAITHIGDGSSKKIMHIKSFLYKTQKNSQAYRGYPGSNLEVVLHPILFH